MNTTWVPPSLVPRPRPKNRERGLVMFLCIFCRQLPLKILRSQSDCRMKPRVTWSCHIRTRPKCWLCNMVEQLVMASSLSPSVFTGDRWTIEIGERCYHAGYQDKLPDCLLALASVPINWDDLSEFVYRQCASKLDRWTRKIACYSITCSTRSCFILHAFAW